MDENKTREQRYGTHLPLLVWAIQNTTGDILELGGGINSTPVIHWLAFDMGRNVVTYDSDEKYFKWLERFKSDTHAVELVTDWDASPIQKEWGLVLIDHVKERRKPDAIKVAHYAQMVVMHDTCGRDDKHYSYTDVYPHYKYIYQYNKTNPKTSVVSNFVDVSKLYEN